MSMFNPRVLRNIIQYEREAGVEMPVGAATTVSHWNDQLRTGLLKKLSESSAEQTFNAEIFGSILGYKQVGSVKVATLMPKRSAGKNTPDFVLGRFDLTAGVEQWAAVGEIKDAKTDLDQPQISRRNRETPVEQGFRYANSKPGVDWVIVTNLREVRLYKNGYAAACHSWKFDELSDAERLFEFYILLRPEGLVGMGSEPIAARAFRESIAVGRDLTEGFYGLYKLVQQDLIQTLEKQTASSSLTTTQLYGKTHKLLNRILFAAFCEDHPAELLPRNTLHQLVVRAQARATPGSYWRSYKTLFGKLNEGGGLGGVSLNAFNGGLFAHDPYFDGITLENELFEKRYKAGRGRRQSMEIVGVFGFQIYDFAEDLNEQALGAIFEQSLKDIISGPALVRGRGRVDVTNQQVGGVYYTPREVTAYITGHSLRGAFERFMQKAEEAVSNESATNSKAGNIRGAERKRETAVMDAYQSLLGGIRILDPTCGSGAFLVEALAQLQSEQEKTNRALAELRGNKRQRSLMDLDRSILQKNLYGRDILPESVELSRLSIWLRTARRGEKLESLNKTITTGDSLRLGELNSYDVIIGNPPWGADLDGWSIAEIQEAFPDAGEEKDSYAIFCIRAWQLLVPGGMLGFIIPNSWLTTNGYAVFRRWLLRKFEIQEVTNTWKIFKDVNHDATIVIAKKRIYEQKTVDREETSLIRIRALTRGTSENSKLSQLAQEDWFISHETTQGFQASQKDFRFETIYSTKVADELDQILARCQRLDEIADVTVGIQAYHYTKVDAETIKNRAFHSEARIGSDWYPYVNGSDVQRYFIEPSSTQWLKYSDLLRDKRELEHYRNPRILVQQVFYQRMSAELQMPSSPSLYMNTLFAVYNSRGVKLQAILGVLNSRFISSVYERLANRLFGDIFPKVSKLDLARLPIPSLSPQLSRSIGASAMTLQQQWGSLRGGLKDASAFLTAISPEARLGRFGEFWLITESDFRARVNEMFGPMSPAQTSSATKAYRVAKNAVDEHWYRILEAETELEMNVQKAFRVSDRVYEILVERAPKPSVGWALRPE